MARYLFTIEKRLPDLNTVINNSKKHWSGFANQKKKLNGFIQRLTKDCEPLTERGKFIFVWYCKNRRRDPDNIAFAKKYILDGMQPHIIASDNWASISGFEDRFEIDSRERVEVYFDNGSEKDD